MSSTSADIAAALHARDIELVELRAELTKARAERDALKMGYLLVPFNGGLVAPISEDDLCAKFGVSPKVARRVFTAYRIGDSRTRVYDLIKVVSVAFGRTTQSVPELRSRRPKKCKAPQMKDRTAA